MASLLNSESRRLYSWWWDSHVSPKNSKWLQENLTDMDAKVKAMIRLIEEDADSFAKRAEMYYKKRPELMKLVEEFYRAYRALAERYNHATGELRHAHRAIAQAFPDQIPFGLPDDAASSSEPGTPVTPQGLKQLNDLFGSSEVSSDGPSSTDSRLTGGTNSGGILSHLSKENQTLKNQVLNESERARKAEGEVQNLKQALTDFEAKRDAIFLQYQQVLEKLSNLEKDLDHAQKDSSDLDVLLCEAKLEIQSLKEALTKVEAERDANLLQYTQSLENLANVENSLSKAQKDSQQLSERAAIAEEESHFLKNELAKLQAEKDAAELRYKECVEKMADLERKLAEAQEKLELLSEQSDRAESEIKAFKEEIDRVKQERDAVAVLYKQSLEIISKLQLELSEAQADNIRLNSEILVGTAKLKSAEDKCDLLDKMNENLKLEAQNLVQRIRAADQELSQKQSELEKLTSSLQEEQSRFLQVETTLHTLQGEHFRSQEQQEALTLELRKGVQMMKDLEISKQDLEEKVQRLKDENRSLNDLNSSCIVSEKNLHEEMLRLKAIKEKLEAEVKCQAEHSEALELQVRDLKQEIKGLYERYQDLMGQVKSVGLDPECFASSIQGLKDENLRLTEISTKDREEREVLVQKLEELEEVIKLNANLESSLSEVNAELNRSKKHAEAMEESCRCLNKEKSSLVSEKAALLSQLQTITETLQNVLEKNSLLHDSLSSANAELEGLRTKSKGLEEFCQLLTSERTNLLAEKSTLVSRLEIVEQKLEKLEMRFTTLEEKYLGLEEEKQSTLSQVDELRVSLNAEKQERACLVLTNEARLSGLEGRIRDLQEENKYRKKEFEEQLEKAVNAQVEIFILQKFIQDMEDKNYSLLIECQRHIEDANYSEKIITELESENMVQEMEAEILLDKIETLRKGIKQVLKALEIRHENEGDLEQNFVSCLLGNIRDMEYSLSESKDENQKILLEKSILTTILGQLHIECSELSSRKIALEEESQTLNRRLVMVEDEKQQLLEKGRQLSMEVHERGKREEALNAQVEDLHMKQTELHGVYVTLQMENLSAFQQNKSLQEELLRIKKEMMTLEARSDDILVEALAFSFQSVVLKSYGIERACERDTILDEIYSLGKAYSDLENESRSLEEKLLLKEMENLTLKASMEDLEHMQHELSARNGQLRRELSDAKELVNQKNQELSEVELKLKANENLNTELCNTVHSLEKDYENLEDIRGVLEQQMAELSTNNTSQQKEILDLRDANGNLESEVNKLHEEIEEYKIREVILTSELHERSSEFEIWEAEATSFYFDLQISNVREVLFENKVHDLGSLCESLEDVSNCRSLEIENMKQRVTSLEVEAESLRSQLTTCLPLIASLKDNISLLETNPVLQSKLHATTTTGKQDIFEQTEGSSISLNAFSELSKLKERIKVIEDILQKEKERAAIHEHFNTNTRIEAALKEIEELKLRVNSHHHYQEEEHRHSGWVSEPEPSEVKSGAEMKDIPLDKASGRSFLGVSRRSSATSNDQMLELWEEAEQDSTCHDQFINEVQEQGIDTIGEEITPQTSLSNPTPESLFEKDLGVDRLELSRRGTRTQSTRKNAKQNDLERLTSDTQKLKSLQISVEELKRKTDPKKRKKKGEDTELDTFKGQLLDLENSIVQLMAINVELIKNIEGSSIVLDDSESTWQKRVSEQVKKEAEKVEKLEQEMQRMEYVFLRLKDEKKSKGKEESSKRSASLVLREFFYSRVRKSKKPKKPRFCGCIRSTATRN